MAAMALSSSSLPLMPSTPRLLTRPSSNFLSFAAGGGRATIALAHRPLRLRLRQRRQPGRGAHGCRCMFGLGLPELVVIAGVVALVFGPKKLPEMGRSFGKTVKSFQQAAKEFETELKKDTEDSIEPPPPESPKAVSCEDEKELETASTEDSA